jgi:peptidoglycan L-alanyl-D-glutamate endopeptidase CwlK
MFKFSKRSLDRMSGVDQRLQDIAKLAIEISIVDFGIPEYGGKRELADQMFLFETGKSKADGVKNESKHQSGLALDFYAYVDGNASWKEKDLALVGCAFLQAAMVLGHRVEWGGLWTSFKDMPHMQLIES